MVACAFCLDIISVGECPSDIHYDAIIALKYCTCARVLPTYTVAMHILNNVA